ncbi:hypothetical protein B0T13DRAFT_481020 [Neurospora crassa]|nr:hypothetical protein B0T13DRAFT_481020 [Neurospora crassa]
MEILLTALVALPLLQIPRTQCFLADKTLTLTETRVPTPIYETDPFAMTLADSRSRNGISETSVPRKGELVVHHTVWV